MNIPEFVNNWKSSTLTERASVQSWFSDLCRVLGYASGSPVVAFAVPRELDETRRRWLDPEGASEDVLKKRTLTGLYNERPTWLRHLHAKLDRAVWDAYGWPGDEVPGEVGEEVILERLLALNRSRELDRRKP